MNNPETAQIDMYGTGTQNRLISKALKSIGIEYGDETFKKIRTEGSNKWDYLFLTITSSCIFRMSLQAWERV